MQRPFSSLSTAMKLVPNRTLFYFISTRLVLWQLMNCVAVILYYQHFFGLGKKWVSKVLLGLKNVFQKKFLCKHSFSFFRNTKSFGWPILFHGSIHKFTCNKIVCNHTTTLCYGKKPVVKFLNFLKFSAAGISSQFLCLAALYRPMTFYKGIYKIDQRISSAQNSNLDMTSQEGVVPVAIVVDEVK